MQARLEEVLYWDLYKKTMYHDFSVETNLSFERFIEVEAWEFVEDRERTAIWTSAQAKLNARTVLSAIG